MLFQSQFIELYNHLPWVNINQHKSVLRSIDSQKRRVMTEDEVHEQSRAIVARIAEMPLFREAKTIMVYYPIHNEVDLRHLVKLFHEEKTFLLPATTSKKDMEVRQYIKGQPLKRGRFGIPEPTTPAWTGSIDLILVPGVAFDKKCRRVGRGGGYYDRFLKRYRDAKKVGVCYDFQLHTEVPHSWFDIPMQCIVTPTQAIGC